VASALDGAGRIWLLAEDGRTGVYEIEKLTAVPSSP